MRELIESERRQSPGNDAGVRAHVRLAGVLYECPECGRILWKKPGRDEYKAYTPGVEGMPVGAAGVGLPTPARRDIHRGSRANPGHPDPLHANALAEHARAAISSAAEVGYTPEQYLALGATRRSNGASISTAACVPCPGRTTITASSKGTSSSRSPSNASAARWTSTPPRCAPGSGPCRPSIRIPTSWPLLGSPRFEDAEQDNLLNPTVIIEVFTPKTEAFDRGEKFARIIAGPGDSSGELPPDLPGAQVLVERYTREGQDAGSCPRSAGSTTSSGSNRSAATSRSGRVYAKTPLVEQG